MPDMPPPPPALVRPAPPGPLLADLLARPRTMVLAANGLRFTCKVWGPPDGPLVLALHGFPDSPATWDDLAPRLARQGYRVVAPWMRGYAPTEAPATDDYGALTLGRDALGLMDALDARQAVVIGHDWGALAAYAAVALAPERVSRLVTIAIPHLAAIEPGFIFGRASHFLTYPLPGATAAMAANDHAGVETIMRKWSPRWKVKPAELAEAKRAFQAPGGTTAILGYYRAFAANALTAARRDAAANPLVRPIAVPTLTLYGDEDGAVDAGVYDRTPRYFTGPYRLVRLGRTGHFPHREEPYGAQHEVLRFLGVGR